MNKNFLFVVPRFAKINEYYNFPSGLGYVISNMKKNMFNVFILNLCHYEESIEFLLSEAIKTHNIHVVCTGAMSVNWNEVDDVLNTVKKINKNIITIVGGAIITSDPELALENMQIDFGVMEEGEETLVELADALCNNKDVKMIRGIGFVDDDKKIHLNDLRPPIKDLDSLPFPDYEGLEFDKWLKMNSIQKLPNELIWDVNDLQQVVDISTSRSCPFRCTFCYHPLGNKYRQRSLDNVFKEIDYLIDNYNITFIGIQDELFSTDEKRIYEFANRIKKYNVKWMAQWRVDNVNENILKIMKDSNIQFLGLGVESLSNTVLKSMKKRTTKAGIEQAYKICDKVGVRPISNIIIGDISETEDTIKESLDWLKSHPEYDINLGFLLAIPNSEIWKYALTNGLINNKLNFIKNRFPIINLTSIDDKRFLKIKKDISIDNIKKKYIIYGKLISSEKTENFYQNQQIYNFNVKCPICSMVSKYSYPKYSYLPFSIVCCKNCHKRLKISTRRAFKESFISGLISVISLNLDIFYVLWLKDNIYWYKLKKGLRCFQSVT